MSAVVTPSGDLEGPVKTIKWFRSPLLWALLNARPHEWENSNGEAFRADGNASESGRVQFVRLTL